MKAQPDVRSAPGAANGQQIKLLLVGGDDELKCNRIRRVSWTDRSWHFHEIEPPAKLSVVLIFTKCQVRLLSTKPSVHETLVISRPVISLTPTALYRSSSGWFETCS